MSVTLSQQTSAAFPERGAIGLRAALAHGNDGQYLEHDLASERAVLHVRVMLSPATAADPGAGAGRAVLIRGLDDAGEETCRLVYDAATRGISAEPTSGAALQTQLPAGIAWHCLELAIDADAGDAQLWANGVLSDASAGGFTAAATRRVQLGVIFKDTALTGDLHLDEWVMADEYIGPVVVPLLSENADDPRRWLVVYNTASTDSIAWAEAYRAARNVPHANLCGLPLSLDEAIDDAGYTALRTAIAAYLDGNGLRDNVLGLLLGYRVPGYADVFDNTFLDPTTALLHNDSGLNLEVANPAVTNPPQRPSKALLGDLRLTARVDAATLPEALALLERATALMQHGLGDGGSAAVWLDPHTSFAASDDVRVAAMLAWASGLEAMSTRLPIHVTDPPPPSEPSYTTIDHDGFFWGWVQATPAAPGDFFAEPAGARVFCIQLNPSAATADTLRSGAASNWVEAALAAGYLAAGGSGAIYSVSAVPDVARFFAALRAGWTLGEAWFVACPVLRAGLFMTGDPLATVPLPNAGWNVYGPARRLEEMDMATPCAMLPVTATSFTLPEALRPPTGEQRVYLLRRVDEAGREEQGTTTVHVLEHDGQALTASASLLWPGQADWPVNVEAGAVRAAALWDEPLVALTLEARTDDGPVQAVEQTAPSALQRAATLVHALPVGATRYRFRAVSLSGVEQLSFWSAAVAREDAPLATLTLL